MQKGQVRRRVLVAATWVVITSVSYFAASYALLLMAALFELQAYFSTTVGTLVAHVILLLFMLLCMLAGNYLVTHRLLAPKEAGTARQITWQDLGLGIAGFFLYALLSMIVLFLAQNVPEFNSTQAQNLGLTTLFGTERLLGFIVLVVLTPVFEELLFRGIFFGRLRAGGLGLWPAGIIVSALFAVAHGQWNVGLDVFCLSLVACYLREFTGSIWAGVIIHMIKNMIAFYFMFIVMQGVGG